MSARAVTIDVKTQIRRLGGTFVKGAEARRDAAALGLAGFPYYFAGRGGVLGDVDPDAVAALFPFFPAELVRSGVRTPGGMATAPRRPALCGDLPLLGTDTAGGVVRRSRRRRPIIHRLRGNTRARRQRRRVDGSTDGIPRANGVKEAAGAVPPGADGAAAAPS